MDDTETYEKVQQHLGDRCMIIGIIVLTMDCHRY